VEQETSNTMISFLVASWLSVSGLMNAGSACAAAAREYSQATKQSDDRRKQSPIRESNILVPGDSVSHSLKPSSGRFVETLMHGITRQ